MVGDDILFLSGCCMAQRGRCPGGRPSVSANKKLSVSREWQLYRPVVKIQYINKQSPESAEHGVGLANGKPTTVGAAICNFEKVRCRFPRTIEQGLEAPPRARMTNVRETGSEEMGC